MFDILLFQPEIPPNTGNIIRLAANTGCRLHLIEPLGFALEDKQLRRAGLDYHEYADLRLHKDWAAARAHFAGRRLFAFSTRGQTLYTEVAYQPGDVLLFGPETRGLPSEVLAKIAEENRIRLPMRPGQRSLNLSNAVAVTVFEAWRRNGFVGGG
ncbi:tRNA (cytidine/uridine-2'-O-)-methyltransferase [Sulfuritortus calidifontis]|uniref:tRNA (cytidine(34)-2'-O)-methyltransferase n=1 Tax=Sulfuritortus calidifontis TaxID=1914471 RepID=A0A4R3JVC1_9PROT|nr:tRNA (cytidine(34)-2'-O)-methyltransferase [Sulfuritortus calidifontis]TCS71883.1 tRNA (cytidine/uridine-2'-O-)-methyltransferase [Sulfuritortus calidifontis]